MRLLGRRRRPKVKGPGAGPVPAGTGGQPSDHTLGSAPDPGGPSLPEEPSRIALSKDLSVNQKALAELIGHSIDLVQREFSLAGGRGPRCVLYYYVALADRDYVHQHVVQPLVVWARPQFYAGGGKVTYEQLRQRLVVASEASAAADVGAVLDGLFDGQAVLLVDGLDQGMVVRAQGYETRALSEPAVEPSVRGSNEGFIEDINTNTALVRRRLKSPHLVVEQMIIGDESRTQVRLVYERHIAPPWIVDELRNRLRQIRVDVVQSCHTIEALIRDHPYTPWPTCQRTERPDRIAALLQQGRIAILVDGEPSALVLPYTVWGYLQSADDFVESPYLISVLRVIRLLALAVSVFLVPTYVALITFHPQVIPLPMLLNIMSSQQGVPLPTPAVAFLMEVVIEVIREAGIRLPRQIGGAVTIVGTIVIGQAASVAGMAPPVLVLLVASAAIASFAVPDFAAATSLRLLRFPALLAGASLGLFGVTAVAVLMLFDLSGTKSLGVPFAALYTPGRTGELAQDFLVLEPRMGASRRALHYRDAYRAGAPPAVRSRIPWLERIRRR